MKRVALLLAGLTLGTTSPAMADAWAPVGPVMVAAKGLQLAQNDDSRRDKRPPAKAEREERGEPRGQREGPQREAPQREAPQREAPQREAPQREAPQREAAPQRDPRYNPDRGETRQPYSRPSAETYERRAPARPEAPVAPQGYAPPRLSERSAIDSVRQRYPGGKVVNSSPVLRNGRTYYQVRVQTRGGELVDILVDGGG